MHFCCPVHDIREVECIMVVAESNGKLWWGYDEMVGLEVLKNECWALVTPLTRSFVFVICCRKDHITNYFIKVLFVLLYKMVV